MSNPKDLHTPEQLGFGGRIALAFLWYGCKFFAWHPYWFRYGVVQQLIYGLLRLFRYRDGVVGDNLRRSFPEKTDAELQKIKRGFYKTLSEIFVDTMSMAGFTDAKCREVARVKGLERHIAAVEGTDWIAMTAHLGCWEYGLFWGVIYPEQASLGVYHTLSSPVFDALYKRLRTRTNIHTVPMQGTMRYYMRHREAGIDGKRIAIGLIADQNPPRRPDSHWFPFLNRDTLFFDGGEKLALRFGLPVYFLSLRRVKPGYYEMSFELIYDGTEPVEPNEITARYVRLLEQHIREHPELWMWSHRRWKHKREP